MTDPRFPIGPLALQEQYSRDEVAALIDIIADAPAHYRTLVQDLDNEDLARTYREGAWTVRQLVHHVADLQFVHYFRIKKAVTEPDYKEPTLVDMNAWAHAADSLAAPVEDSLRIFEGVHSRYAFFARTLTDEQLAISYFHGLRKIWITQAQALAMSAWHVQHHLAHIKIALGLPV
ncbi:DinB family protein [Dyadobacter sandarakinus]|uniref:DinB family protein n=1 Tax=Dyadobacter sandarakinus TaxID=2747268 RepID=A0ABX7I8N1_9BACT|nr:DinB family protein [Dyadobacter sandarakinus]QRR02068.1 DinB family protein [Dyadobacter sandarakinus]